jgi:hypothetical protein
MLNSISSTSYTSNNYSVTNSGQTNNVLNTTSNPYGGDNFTYNNSLTQSIISSYPISQIITESPSLANRFSKFFMSNSETFLKVGSNWLGKSILNLLAGNIPLITSKSVSTQISNNINIWLGRSDLVRVGMTPTHASIMQQIGIKNINDLSVITNPSDQTVVAQMFNSTATSIGIPLFVDAMTISSWVNTAKQLPKYL